MKPESQRSSGIIFCGLLFLVFLVLKLTNIINWSWWWITAPLWIPAILIIIFVLLVAIVLTKANKDLIE